MGKLEKESKRRARKNNLKKIILGVVKSAGLLSVALVAPNILKTMHQLGLRPTGRQKESINVSRDRLVKKGLLEYKKGFLVLAKKGETTLRRLELSNFKLKKPRRWDGKWRVLIFDIPEKRRRIRDQIRATLVSIGFVRLQDSVWVYPHDCEDIIMLLKSDFKIGKDVLYVIVEMLEQDTNLKKHFGLQDY